MKLLDDVARCNGKTVKAENPLNQQCDDCARFDVIDSDHPWMIFAPEFINGKCPERIEE